MTMPDWIAAGACIESGSTHWSRAVLEQRVDAATTALEDAVGGRGAVALLCDNGPEWVAIDLAAHAAGIAVVPLPDFFSAPQVAHAIAAAGVRALVCPDAARARALGFGAATAITGSLSLFARPTAREHDVDLPHGRHKITFTSGTTADPKGVWLSLDAQARTARALASLLRPLGIRRHLCALPLPVLLENVAGVYTALALGAACICPPLVEVGLRGGSGFDADRFLDAVGHYRPDSVIVLPEMLRAIVAALPAGPRFDARTRSLKLVAVGGAKTPAALIAAARERGVPAYEGYGLTECGSVVSLNVPGADRIGSAGKVLPHVRVRVAPGAHVEIETGGGIGYLDGPDSAAGEWLRTGDLGAIDDEGYLCITGRSTNVLVTSFGRNVSPEWPEALLTGGDTLAQAAVFGEARPWLSAIVVASSPQVPNTDIAALVDAVNAKLPDYARIGHWIRASEPFTVANAQATANGRPRRTAIYAKYRQALESGYDAAPATHARSHT